MSDNAQIRNISDVAEWLQTAYGASQIGVVSLPMETISLQ